MEFAVLVPLQSSMFCCLSVLRVYCVRFAVLRGFAGFAFRLAGLLIFNLFESGQMIAEAKRLPVAFKEKVNAPRTACFCPRNRLL